VLGRRRASLECIRGQDDGPGFQGGRVAEEQTTQGTAVAEAQQWPVVALDHAADHRMGLAVTGGPNALGGPLSKERWDAYTDVPVRLSVRIPLKRMSLNEVLCLRPGEMLVSKWQLSQDVPLLVGEVFLANVSCEPAGDRLGVRINGFDQPL